MAGNSISVRIENHLVGQVVTRSIKSVWQTILACNHDCSVLEMRHTAMSSIICRWVRFSYC